MPSLITVRIASNGKIHFPDQRSTECHKCHSKGFTRRERKDPDRAKIIPLVKEDVLTRIPREARGPAVSMLPTMSAHSTRNNTNQHRGPPPDSPQSSVMPAISPRSSSLKDSTSILNANRARRTRAPTSPALPRPDEVRTT